MVTPGGGETVEPDRVILDGRSALEIAGETLLARVPRDVVVDDARGHAVLAVMQEDVAVEAGNAPVFPVDEVADLGGKFAEERGLVLGEDL